MTRARTIADFGDGIATADIDDGAVTAGKLNSTLDLSGKTVTLPSGVGGKVLQVVTAYDASATSTSGTYADVFSPKPSITLASTSSTVLIFATGYGRCSNSGGAADVGINMRVVNDTSQTELADVRMRAQALNDYNGSLVISHAESGFSGTSQTYNLQINRYGGNDTAAVSDIQVMLLEIAG